MNEELSKVTAAWRVFNSITYKKIETDTIDDTQVRYRDPDSPTGFVQPIVAMAPCGGPIAMVYKRVSNNANDFKYIIYIQNLPNRKAKTREFNRGVIVLVDWTIREDLLLVTDDGKYHILDIFHHDLSNDITLTLSESVSSVTSASMFKTNQGRSLVALRKNTEGFVAIKADIYDPTVQFIPLPADFIGPISAWCVTDHSELTILFACDSKLSICAVGSSVYRSFDTPDLGSKVIKLVASSNYQKIAMLKDNGSIYICSRDKLSDRNAFVLKYSDTEDKIENIAWSGADTVIAIRLKSKNWFDVLIIDAENQMPMSDESKRAISDDTLGYTSTVHLFTEVDGVRIISGRNLDFFQRLPDTLFNVLSLMSSRPGATLFSAFSNYKCENQFGEVLLNQLKSSEQNNTLAEAVKQCILAASLENDPAIQKLLLKAALFGRSFLHVDLNGTNRSVVKVINELCTNVIRNLTLINNLQNSRVSIPMTYKQFDILGPAVLIDRLLRRNLHDFATYVTKLLRMPASEGENRILLKWAVKELTDPINNNEEALAEKIKDRLANVPGISFIDIAREAFKLKKFLVVRKLLDVKVSLSDQIEMLLALNDKEEALQKAVSCGETDLILFVLMRIKASESLTDYMLRLKKSKNLPLKLHLQCLEELERNKLHVDLIKQNPEERERIAYSHIYQRFLSALTTADQRSELTSAAKQFRDAKKDTVAQLCEDEAQLLSRQEALEKKIINVQLKGLSLVNTIEALILRNEQDAENLKKEFSLPEKRFCWIKIQAYAKNNAWAQLFDFAKRSNSLIGYEPFIDVCLHHGRADEARRYADRSQFSSKIDEPRLPFLYAKTQMVDEAINAAVKLKSLDALFFIESKCQMDATMKTRLQKAKEKLQDSDQSRFGSFFSSFQSSK